MKKTLYISDLDGTLLGSNEFLSPFAVDTINQLIHEGAIISIATARNLTSATPRIKDLNFQIPIILNNGVAMYNWQTRHYTYVAGLAASDIDIMGQILREEKCTGYMYALKNEEICMFHNPLYTPEDQAYGGASAEKTNTNEAVEETSGIVLVCQGKIVPAYYSASAGGKTKTGGQVWSSDLPFLKSVPSFDDGIKKNGHGVGMSQYGANNLAKRGYNAYQILKYFYCFGHI